MTTEEAWGNIRENKADGHDYHHCREINRLGRTRGAYYLSNQKGHFISHGARRVCHCRSWGLCDPLPSRCNRGWNNFGVPLAILHREHIDSAPPWVGTQHRVRMLCSMPHIAIACADVHHHNPRKRLDI